MKAWVMVALVTLLLGGCAARLPAVSPRVPPRPLGAWLAPPPRSLATVRLDLSLAPLERALEGALPATLHGEREVGSGVQLRWALERQPLTVGADADGLVGRVELRGHVELSSPLGRCTSDDAGLALRVAFRPSLDGAGFIVIAAPRVESQPAGEVRCAGLPLPLAPLVSLLAWPLERAVEQSTRLVRLPLVPLAGPLLGWGLDELARPRSIEVAGRAGCLDLDPRALVISPVTGERQTAALRLAVDVAPRVTLGACASPSPSPPARSLEVRGAPLADAFAVDVAVGLEHAWLTERLRAALVGHRFGDGTRAVIVRSVALDDAGGRLLLRVEVSGALAGAVYLWGTPALAQPDGRTRLTVPDLQVAVETRSLLTRLRLWTWQLWDGGLTAALRRALELDLSERFEAARRSLSVRRTLVTGPPSLTLDARISRIDPGPVQSIPGALVVHLRLVGVATIDLQ